MLRRRARQQRRGCDRRLVRYDAAFLFLAACATGAFLLFWLGVPETRAAGESAPRAAVRELPARA